MAKSEKSMTTAAPKNESVEQYVARVSKIFDDAAQFEAARRRAKRRERRERLLMAFCRGIVQGGLFGGLFAFGYAAAYAITRWLNG